MDKRTVGYPIRVTDCGHRNVREIWEKVMVWKVLDGVAIKVEWLFLRW